MRVEHRDDGSVDVYVRQSWIKDAMMCNERGRQGIVRPDWSSTANELTAAGTAVHAGIAAVLLGLDDSGYDSMMVEWQRLLSEPMRIAKAPAETMVPLMVGCLDNWHKHIAPVVADDGAVLAVEEPFEFLLDEFRIGDMNVRIHGKGTADLMAENGLWDWKTAARKYNVREKQEQDIQSTMYAAAAVAAGRAAFPVTFKFGVMVRGAGAQIVPVHRTTAHLDWFKSIVRQQTRQTILMGTEEPWVVNDTHYLCSQTWCPWFSICKGAHLAPADHAEEATQ